MDTTELGRQLAARHGDSDREDAPQVDLDPARCLLNYAEVPYEEDWTLRSALMRLAQPEPALVGRVLELSRRLDAPLHHVRKTLESHVVIGDLAIDAENLDGPPLDPCPDARAVDLARLIATGYDQTSLLAGYEERHVLEHEERLAIPLLVVAVAFERLAEIVTAWALIAPSNPPVDAVDGCVEMVASELDRLGVPEETGPPPGQRRGSRG